MKFQSEPQHVTRRIVVCGSMGFYSEMLPIKRRLRKFGVPSAIPDMDKILPSTSSTEGQQKMKRTASMRHIRRVRDQKTIGILVLNFDKHGIPNYIGPNTFAEIAIAFAHYKQIYLYQGMPAFYRDELTAWGAISLDGNFSALISHFREVEVLATLQLSLFDSLFDD